MLAEAAVRAVEALNVEVDAQMTEALLVTAAPTDVDVVALAETAATTVENAVAGRISFEKSTDCRARGLISAASLMDW
ncbi:hypothetical protein GN244_ATG19597 [Phytophthora infestans]|uniref:Uncharacterized protein n=1 Tax=Phytophthora infestans TaxID=4787 RepID=A0A833SIY4_PHYIN|nr:hypothetical protein GN244_ATG19597 [Phytophthora infestans]